MKQLCSPSDHHNLEPEKQKAKFYGDKYTKNKQSTLNYIISEYLLKKMSQIFDIVVHLYKQKWERNRKNLSLCPFELQISVNLAHQSQIGKWKQHKSSSFMFLILPFSM